MTLLLVEVPGTPRPQGSLRAFKRGGMAYSNATALEPWRMAITAHARQAMADCTLDPCWPLTEPIKVEVTFLLTRPAGQYGTGRNAHVLKPGSPMYPTKQPDLDKLQRAILDGLTDAGVWVDDAQVVTITANKRFARWDSLPGAAIWISTL